jgi:uncharacterized delta-60 repeat protein
LVSQDFFKFLLERGGNLFFKPVIGRAMKKILLAGIFLFVFCASLTLNAQWARTYGGSDFDRAFFIQQTSDGGYVAAGYTASDGAGISDFWVLKVSLAGIIEWQYTYGGSGDDVAYAVQETSDEGYIIAGYTYSFGAGESDCWILKLNSEGDIEWQYTYGGIGEDAAYAIQETSDGGYIVAGCTQFGSLTSDMWILKLTSEGDVEWQHIYGGTGDDKAYSVQETSEGGYIVAGSTQYLSTQYHDFWVLKLTSAGYFEWQRIYGGYGDDVAYFIQETSDEGYIVAGDSDSFGSNESELWILKLTSIGGVEWERIYGESDNDYLNSIQETSDEGYIVTGNTYSFGAGDSDILALKLSSEGNIEWQRTYGGSEEDVAYYIQETSDEGYIVAGYTDSFGAGESDFLLLKLFSDGDVSPACELVGSSDATVQNTSSIALYSNITAQPTSAQPQSTEVSPQETSASSNLLCEAQPTISGTVKTEAEIGLEGVTITFSGEQGTATTDSEGSYSHQVSYGWSGEATPSKTGYIFSPSSRTYNSLTSDQTEQDYTATVVYTISGSVKTGGGVGIEGVEITFSAGQGTATTNSEGSYSHLVIEGWSGDATPSKTCYTFSPSSRTYTNVVSDQSGQDYTGTMLTYTISGTIIVAASAAPLSGVVMEGLPGSPTTDASGYYEAIVDCGWSGTVTPTRTRYVFSPSSRTYDDLSSDQAGQDYDAYPGWIISGSVKTEADEGIAGVEIAFSGVETTATTSADGSYSATVIEGWSGDATPYKTCYNFSPSSRSYSDLASDQTNQDYTGSLIQYTLTIDAGEGGTTEPSPGSHDYDCGTLAEITATPNSGYDFSDWSGDVPSGYENDNPLIFTMNSDKSLTANFKRKPLWERLCFIATAAYNSPLHPHVRILRDFRDEYLLSSRQGRVLVNLYYKYSPPVAEFITKHKALKVMVRINLLPFVALSYSMLHFGPIITALTLLFIFLLPIFLIRFYRKKTRSIA